MPLSNLQKLTKEEDNIIKVRHWNLGFPSIHQIRIVCTRFMRCSKKKKWTIKDLDGQVLSLCDVGEIAKDSDEIDSCALDIQRCISQQISAKPVLGAPQNTSPVVVEEFVPAASGLNQASLGISPGTAASQSSHRQTRSKLPKLNRPEFRGDANKFRTFWDSLESAVKNNPELSKIGKFKYLHQQFPLESEELQVKFVWKMFLCHLGR